ncbi:MAG: diguanylate cyclase [Motiliproteus sp.]
MRKIFAVPGTVILTLGTSVIIVLLLLLLWNERTKDLNLARANATYVAELMGANVRRTVDELADQLYGTRSAALLLAPEATPKQQQQTINALATDLLERKPFIRTFFIVSPQGDITQWNRDQPRPSVADREYVQHHVDHPESGLYISQPIRSKLDDQWIILASLPLRSPQGELTGVVAISIEPEVLAPRYLQSIPSTGFDLGILKADSQVIWSNTHETGERFISSAVSDSPWLELKGSGNLETLSIGNQGLRLVGYQQFEQSSIYIVASLSVDSVLKNWRMQRNIAGFSVFFLVVMSVGVGRRLVAGHNRLLEQHQKLELLATRDALTGLPNRRFLWDQAKRLIASAQRHRFSLAVIMLDIDHFKRVNDSYGHDVGDRVLISLANLIGGVARETDLTCRLGGEEFAIVFSHTSDQQATVIAERIREQVKLLSFDTEQDSFGITVSVGVSTLVDNLDIALKSADEALYVAKNSGRDRVINADQRQS